MNSPDSYWEEQDSQDVLVEHGPALAAEAAQVFRHDPDLAIVGVVIDAGTPEWEYVQRISEGPGPPAGQGLVGIMEREIVLRLLREQNPALLDWLVDSDARGERPVLPTVAFTANGARTGKVEIALDR